jgi:predicted kinase
VVLDASWSHAAHREAARAMAAATHSELGELECTVAPGIAATRIARRRSHAPSDATPAVATAMRSAAAPWPSAVRIDTDAPRATVVAAARRAVRR